MAENTTSRPLPAKFLERGMELAEGAAIFGVPLTDLTREELLAVAAQGWHTYRVAVERHIGETRTLMDFRRR